MIGTLVNIATVITGGTLGMLFGSRIPERLRSTVIHGLGLFTLGYGIYIFLDTENPLLVLGSLLLGALAGEWWRIEDRLQNLGSMLEQRFSKAGTGTDRFVKGFLTSSLLFCVGPMTILGAIQDGLVGDHQILVTKAIMDGFAAMAFASTLGLGVLFSTLVILVYQGGISLLASQFSALLTAPMMTEMTATGGVILAGIAISSLLEIKPIRVGSFLPALLVAPLLVFILQLIQTG